jgi:hypothetical protein
MEGKEFIADCAYCGKKPTIVCLPGDLFYAQCPHKQEGHKMQGVYDYLGITRHQCIDTWNKAQYSLSHYIKAHKKGDNDEFC